MVEMTKGDDVQAVHPDLVDVMTASGWKLRVDPAELTVDEVVAHLDGLPDTEKAAVIEAEKAGKNRTSIVAKAATDITGGTK